jgi:hypothetical protein
VPRISSCEGRENAICPDFDGPQTPERKGIYGEAFIFNNLGGVAL